jgi:hypothetical protein
LFSFQESLVCNPGPDLVWQISGFPFDFPTGKIPVGSGVFHQFTKHQAILPPQLIQNDSIFYGYKMGPKKKRAELFDEFYGLWM